MTAKGKQWKARRTPRTSKDEIRKERKPRTPKENKMVCKTYFRIPETLKKELKKKAEELDMSLPDYIRNILLKHLNAF